MYLIILTIGMVASYFAIAFILAILLNVRPRLNNRRHLLSCLAIIALTVAGYYLAAYLYSFDKEFSNRFLHAIVGAFNVFMILFLVIKDFQIRLSKLQYMILGVLFVSFLGVVNEILEYFMQVYFGFRYSTTPLDTWLDLISNSVGALIGILTFTAFVHKGEATNAKTRV